MSSGNLHWVSPIIANSNHNPNENPKICAIIKSTQLNEVRKWFGTGISPRN